MDSYESDPKTFLERSFNEFTVVDLEDTLEAVGFDSRDVRGYLNYYNVYINTGHGVDLMEECRELEAADPVDFVFHICFNNTGSDNLEDSYDDATDIKPFLAKIDRPFLIYFSQDDPILSSYDNSGQPEVITEILEDAKNNPNVIVFNPRYGGHIGVFLDPVFEELLMTFFNNPM